MMVGDDDGGGKGDKTGLQAVWFAGILTGRFQCDALWRGEISKAAKVSKYSVRRNEWQKRQQFQPM
jgi:hypothetical protein